MSSTTIRLSEAAEINPRLPARPAAGTPVSFLGMADLNAESGTTSRGTERQFSQVSKGYTQFIDGDLLVAKITPCFENGKIAQAKLDHSHGAGSTEFHVVRPDRTKFDDRFILRFLRQPYVRIQGERRMTGSVGQRRVPEAFLANLQIPLLPLDEQRRLAQVLDSVDALRSKRRTAIALLGKLAQSIFIDMFGSVDESWPQVTVENIAEDTKGAIRTGPFGSQLLHEEFVDSGVPVLGIDNAVANEFQWKGRRYITKEKYQKLTRYTVHPGDVLITIMGTCGRCAVVPNDIPLAINTKHLCCITLDQSKCLPEFLHSYFLIHRDAQRYLKKTAKGAIMDGLNMAIIKRLPISLPPIGLQRTFAQQIASLRATNAANTAHLAELDTLFVSLQSRTFRS
jgi:type I restriction enzyme, S subunit